MERACRAVLEQWATGRTMVPGEWNRSIYLFLMAEKGVSGTKRSPEGNLCRDAEYAALGRTP